MCSSVQRPGDKHKYIKSRAPAAESEEAFIWEERVNTF